MRNVMFISLLLGASLVAGPTLAQQPAAPPPAYGEQIDIEHAKKAAAAAVVEAKKISTFMAARLRCYARIGTSIANVASLVMSTSG